MKIIGEIPHPRYKITAFMSNGKVSIKFENGLLEQSLKFRDGSGVDSFEDVKKLCNETILEVVSENFKSLQRAKIDALVGMHSEDDEFEKII